MGTVPVDVKHGLGSPFEGITTYREQFPWPKPQDRSRRIQAQGATVNGIGAPFEGSTSYNTDFIPQPLAPRAPVRPMSARRTAQPFEGSSTYSAEYKKHPLARTMMCRPKATKK